MSSKNKEQYEQYRLPFSEHDVEQNLVEEVKRAGGWAPKFTSPGTNGMPDRIVLLPGGHMGFVEVKAPGKKPRPQQLLRHKRLRELGFQVFVMDDFDQAQTIIESIRTEDEGNNGSKFYEGDESDGSNDSNSGNTDSDTGDGGSTENDSADGDTSDDDFDDDDLLPFC